ncbi:MAG: ferrochelatase [Hyphomicrobiales bacterium]
MTQKLLTKQLSDRVHEHPKVEFGRVGVLLVNLGTPEGFSYWPMRRYLKEFLSDRRVIEVPAFLWTIILNLFILPFRPQKSGRAYAKIWNRQRNESPLKTISRAQAEKLSALLDPTCGIRVEWAMRYGLPPIADRLVSLKEEGCERVLLFPLYPQYSASTTASANEKAFDSLKTMRWHPAIRTVPPYYDHPAYIDALCLSLEHHLSSLDWKPEIVLASFHGLPKSNLHKGDPYHCHCQKTARLLREKLGWPQDRLRIAFQSRFGREEWLKPYTDETVEMLARSGVKRLGVITPGFAADCVETLEEIAIAAGELFRRNGGEKFSLIPCLNDSDIGIDMFKTIIEEELRGWLKPISR